jgi:hypothetical protein
MEQKKQVRCAEAYYHWLKVHGLGDYLKDVKYTDLADAELIRLFIECQTLNCEGLCRWYNKKCHFKFAPTAYRRINLIEKRLGPV